MVVLAIVLVTVRDFIDCIVHINSQNDKILNTKMGRVCRLDEGRIYFKILTGKQTGKRSPGRPRCRWQDIIRMDL